MKKTINEEQPLEILRELCVADGSVPGVGIFKALRSFYLPVRQGPNEALKIDALVELSAETARENFFLGRVLPYDPAIPQVGLYRVIRPIRIVIDKLWVELKPGEKIELSADESLPFLREEKIVLEEVSK